MRTGAYGSERPTFLWKGNWISLDKNSGNDMYLLPTVCEREIKN
jgi:hypothetical protein